MEWQTLLPLKRKVTCNKSMCISLSQCSGRTRLRDVMKWSEVCPVHRATDSGPNTGVLCRQLSYREQHCYCNEVSFKMLNHD